jgi:hypothetical protein
VDEDLRRAHDPARRRGARVEPDAVPAAGFADLPVVPVRGVAGLVVAAVVAFAALAGSVGFLGVVGFVGFVGAPVVVGVVRGASDPESAATASSVSP